MFVIYDGANQHTVSAGPGDRIVLNPGRNSVDKEAWNRILASAEKEENAKGGLNYLLENGIVTVSESIDLTEMPPKKAIDVISKEINVDILTQYLEQESSGKNREKVIDAIVTQVDAVEAADAPNEPDNN